MPNCDHGVDGRGAGHQPVHNASVSLGVEIETGNGTFLGMSPRRMLDTDTLQGE